SSDDRKPGDGNLLRRASAGFRLTNIEPVGISKPAFPPDGLGMKSEPENDAAAVKPSTIRGEILGKSAPQERVAFVKSPPRLPMQAPSLGELPVPTPAEQPDVSGESSVSEPPSLWARIIHPNALMNLLLDSREGLVILLLFAALAGAAHALTPGHGKTL